MQCRSAIKEPKKTTNLEIRNVQSEQQRFMMESCQEHVAQRKLWVGRFTRRIWCTSTEPSPLRS